MLFKSRTPKQAKSALAKLLENGTFDVGSPEFRRLCAIQVDGLCLVASGYQHNAEMRTERKKLVASGRIPAITDTRIVTLSEVAEAYNARAPRAGEKADGPALASTVDVRMRVESLLVDCANARASDLAIVLRDFHTDLRMKVGGAWHDFKDQWTRDEGRVALECLFNAREEGSGQTVREQRSFQSFSITSTETLRLPAGVVKLRGQRGFHETAADIGDHHVVRFFYSEGDKNTSSIESLGFDAEILEAFESMRHSSDGAMIVGGSTGDGKSTTLIRSVQRLIEEKQGRTSVVTIEDPVEMRLDDPAIMQIPVSSAGDGENREEVYRRALMHFSRVNPDVGIISEMRDGYGARQVLQFVSSGHTCYTTIHTNSVNEIPFRLIGWGIPAAELARPGLIKVMVQQKLVKHLCKECSVPFDGSQVLPKYLRILDADQLASLRFRNPEGCPACVKDYTGVGKVAWAGYERLIAVGELVEPDETYLSCIGRNDGLGAMQHWRKPKEQGGLGGVTIGEKIRRDVLMGLVDPDDGRDRGAGDVALGPKSVAAATGRGA
ncbi:ATPase, T2SS/T4P/T4SS family [Cognatiyoonia sp. IB215182]|uniref:ATPase, T2SS/T4P/T4SS family n=1 Tax=Cognatiyoonia sp. IB215182 TaxID=3097353 RepID=UPI002A0DE9CB|nr:ATPase, T2SS/T4P/T4SS family [Cognatiyoonia sp. IB215182]MDX8355404.1 ATPase, T2SS/T4P/T4SS family [Cognatiyoonia sp. IB215182]